MYGNKSQDIADATLDPLSEMGASTEYELCKSRPYVLFAPGLTLDVSTKESEHNTRNMPVTFFNRALLPNQKNSPNDAKVLSRNIPDSVLAIGMGGVH